MVQDTIPINLSRLKDYFPELEKLYNRNIPIDNEPLLMNAEISLEIDEGEQDAFERRYLFFIEKYGIPEDTIGDVLYINQKITYDLNSLTEFSMVDNNVHKALDFLIGYQKLVEEVEVKKMKNKEGYKTNQADPIIIQVKEKGSNGAISLNYDGSGRFIVNMIYQAFKTSFNNTSLSYVFEEYTEIPPLKTLLLLRAPDFIRHKVIAQEMLSKTAVILSKYFEDHFAESVYKRKKNLIIYELFYLFDTLKYAGKVMKIDSSKDLKRVNLKTDYILPLDESKHSDFIKELIKNNNRRDTPLSGAFMTFTKP